MELQYVKGVGPKLAELLKKLGLHTVQDFFYFFPRAYDDRRQLPKLYQLKANDSQSCVGTIDQVLESQVKQKLNVLKCILRDATGTVTAVWFNQPFLKRVLKPGRLLVVKGKVEINAFTGELQMAVTETEVLTSITQLQESVGCIMPIYPLVAGLHQHKMRQIAKHIITHHLSTLSESIPKTHTQTYSISLKEAIKELHFPTDRTRFKQARDRIAYEEFFYFQLSLANTRQHIKTQYKAPILSGGNLITTHINQLPYTLTNAQKKVIEEISEEVNQDRPMNRLIQGDVGCGKTDVAIVALLMAIQNKWSGVLMAPTEILATQHYEKISQYLEKLGIDAVLLKGKQRSKIRREALARIADFTPCVIIGTHALIEESVSFNRIGMVVIDEQHRFGVVQRQRLKTKGNHPHCLYMTATPIPRSFMLTAYGDLDKSIIDEMPPGRIPPQTVFIREGQLQKVFYYCRDQINQGRQIYVVYPLIEESEKLDLKSAIDGWEMIKTDIFPDYNIALLHGRMKSSEKEAVMSDFKAGHYHVLVATTVIEVGIDVPNATVMVIQHAERFGLSQLHQLRGRIGRGAEKSTCFLISNPKNDTARKRIKAMVSTQDGFKIAEYDLSIRGPGDMLGTRQSGLPDFKIADIIRDEPVLLNARKHAFALIQKDPTLTNHPDIKQEMRKRYAVATSPLN